MSPPNELECAETQQVAAECVWSDPAMEDQEPELDSAGFGASLRGGGTVCFGNRAIDDFLAENSLSFIIRAHEAHAYGVSLSKQARVFTVFSTSKDHDQGKFAMCGCILVDEVLIQVINRSPRYRNRFVHRRDSISLDGVSSPDIEQRKAIGLVKDAIDEDDGAYEDEYDDDDDGAGDGAGGALDYGYGEADADGDARFDDSPHH